MSNATEQSAVVARAGRPFTFTRKRGGTGDDAPAPQEVEFFPGAGSTLHFANRDTDTFTARGLPAGLLLPGDEVIIDYNGTTVFRGDVKTITDSHGRGDERVQDVTVAGPWDRLCRLVFRQEWTHAGAGENGADVTFSSSRVILGQTTDGDGQHMKAQIAEIVGYAATPCGVALGSNAAPEQYLPLDEARDITCADAIRRELRFFPKLVVRFDYSGETPALTIAAPSGSDAAYVASIPKTERTCQYDAHPVSCVDVAVDATDIVVGGKSATYHQIYPLDGDPDDLDCLHVTVPLERGSASTTRESFKIETEDIPGESDDPSVPDSLDDANWWRSKHPRLADVAPGAISIGDGSRSPANYPRILKNAKDEVEAAGLHCEVSRFTCKCRIETADDEENEILLSMDFLTTDARTRTYTVQLGSESVEAETLPEGLAQALYEQRSGSLASEQMTVRLGASLPTLGDMADGLVLQSFDVDCADLTARLSFGRPEHLSAEDMRSLLNGFRQRGYASTAKLRKEKADEDAEEEDAPGGIPPIASSEWAPGVKAKTTIKGVDSAAGKIVIAAADVAGETAEFREITYQDGGGRSLTCKVLATPAQEDGGEGEDNENECSHPGTSGAGGVPAEGDRKSVV